MLTNLILSLLSTQAFAAPAAAPALAAAQAAPLGAAKPAPAKPPAPAPKAALAVPPPAGPAPAIKPAVAPAPAPKPSAAQAPAPKPAAAPAPAKPASSAKTAEAKKATGKRAPASVAKGKGDAKPAAAPAEAAASAPAPAASTPPTSAPGSPSPPTTGGPVPAPAPTTSASDLPFLEAFPSLREYVYVEPESGFHLGFGLSPLGILKDRTIFSADIFQLHWISHRYEIQILNASFGITRADNTAYQSSNFTFSAAFNVRVNRTISLGPLIGYEFVSFSNLKAKLFKSPFISPEEPFSSQGVIYGGNVTEIFPWRSYLIQLSEVVYEETYSNEKTPQNWRYIFSDQTVRNQPSLIAPRLVALIKVSLLF